MRRVIVLLMLFAVFAGSAFGEGLSGLDVLLGPTSDTEAASDLMSAEELFASEIGDEFGLALRFTGSELVREYEGRREDGFVYLLLHATAANYAFEKTNIEFDARLFYEGGYEFDAEKVFAQSALDMLVEAKGVLVFRLPEQLLALGADALVLSVDVAGAHANALLDMSAQAEQLGISGGFADGESQSGLVAGDAEVDILKEYGGEADEAFRHIIVSLPVLNMTQQEQLLAGTVNATFVYADKYTYKAKVEYSKTTLAPLEAQPITLSASMPLLAAQAEDGLLRLDIELAGEKLTRDISLSGIKPQSRHAYVLFTGEKLNWSDAKAKCEQMGGYLATITSAEEKAILTGLVGSDYYSTDIWIGGTADSNRVWSWITGEPWEYQDWYSNQPSKSTNDNRILFYKSQFYSYGNNNRYMYICEWDDEAKCPYENYTPGLKTDFAEVNVKLPYAYAEVSDTDGLVVKNYEPVRVMNVYASENDPSYRWIELDVPVMNTSAQKQILDGSVAAKLTFRERYAFDADVTYDKNVLSPLEIGGARIVFKVPAMVVTAPEEQLAFTLTLNGADTGVALSLPQGAQASVAAGDYVYFGRYERDANTYNGAEKLEWLVLDVQDGKALLVTGSEIDAQRFHNTNDKVHWKDSSLRTWLNGTFAQTAFTAEELSSIMYSDIETLETATSNATLTTRDRVFLLSQEEANAYFANDDARRAHVSKYAINNGAYSTSSNGYQSGWWWLRTPATGSYSAMDVNYNGKLETGNHSNSDRGGVRPAVWVDISVLTKSN